MSQRFSHPYKIPSIAALSIVLFLLGTALLVQHALQEVKQQERDNVRNALQTVLQTTQDSLHLWKTHRFLHIEEQANRAELIALTEQLLSTDTALEAQSLNALRALLQPVLVKNHDQGFFIIDPARINRASMRDSNLNQLNLIEQQRPKLLEAVFNGHTQLIPTITSDVPLPSAELEGGHRQPTMFFASPIYDSEQKIIAVLALRADPSKHFSRITQLGRLGTTGDTYAFDRQGIMLTHSRFDTQLHQIGLLQPGQRSPLTIRISDPGGNLLTGHRPTQPRHQQPLTKMVSHSLKNSTGYDTYRDYRGVPVFGAWIWDTILGVGLATEIDAQEAMQTYQQTRQILIWLLSSTVVLGVLLLVLIFWLKQRETGVLKQAYALLEQRVQERTQELANATQALEEANRQLHLQAHTDSLTGLPNRRELEVHLQKAWQHCHRENKPFSIIMLDIDYFKRYNDHYGHQQGDACLTRLSSLFKEIEVARRPGDLIARYGGEEFIVILSGADEPYAIAVAEQIRCSVVDLHLPHADSGISNTSIVTLSLGVASAADTRNSDIEQLIKRADNALYQAKESGRNRVNCDTSLTQAE